LAAQVNDFCPQRLRKSLERRVGLSEPAAMTDPTPDLAGAIDCDVHPRTPTPADLLPFMDEQWRDTVRLRGIENWTTIGYPADAPFTVRGDWRAAKADMTPAGLAKALLDPHGLAHAICNPLFPVSAFRDPTLAAVFARATNDWLAAAWLAKDARLRGALLVPFQAPDLAVEEIARHAGDRRFVQVLTWAMGEQPLGKGQYWPIYAACEKHGFALAIHSGSSYHHAVTSSGWPSYWIEDYAAQSQGFHTQLGSLIAEGVFVKFPHLKVVLTESGVTWLPAYLWRLGKFWRGLRSEVPWLDRPPADYVRDHVRLTLQPFDGPDTGADMARLIGHLPSEDMVLFSTDFPHWQFDGAALLPSGLPKPLERKILTGNARATYPRLTSPPTSASPERPA
jgi:uncharacterized protein